MNGDDIEIYADEARAERLMTWHNLRQQNQKPTGRANLCLADFVAPKEAGVADWIGAFAVTAGGIDERVARVRGGQRRLQRDHAEGARRPPRRGVRRAAARARAPRVLGLCARREASPTRELIAEEYRGIRPAPGYPACPDHTAKGPLFRLLDAERNAGMRLTESFAMLPAAAVSGFYLSHPESSYFAVGKIGRDQVEDYARRSGMPLAEAEKWLAPYLAYEPETVPL